ncbi:hypothetical protein E8E14_013971 [Neopestalotiopsis sp. 37M]|nr:hypothetical protein E8E14_013971 [Neopestalotiopsis sp. 37M]
MTTNHDRPKVYRLQGLPDRPNFDRLAAAQFVANVINDPTLTAEHIHICSLATTVEPHKRWNRKVATVMFRHTPLVLSTGNGASSSAISEWRFPVPGQAEPLVLDSHFLGLTVLNDVIVAEHNFDCIAMSGLASHPFGSWQPKGDDKSYMWIRDTLPTTIGGVRFILFGYDTTLNDSNSFQSIVDLADSLYLTLQTNGWGSPSAKPLVFLAHSLGGVLLKQLLVILAGANDSTRFMLNMIKGAMFFGTPSRGMAMGQLLTMVGDQPNRDLIEHLSETSEFLSNLETQFTGISQIQRMRLYWAYETKTSPTVQNIDGSYKRLGPRLIMVDRQSATGSRTLDPSYTIQIDEDHSDMVKFNTGDRRVPIIISKIQEMCFSDNITDELDTVVSTMSVVSDAHHGSDANYRGPDLLEDARNSELMGWDYDLIISLFEAPVRDQIHEEIDKNFGHTFSWAFENPTIGLSQWLREGKGIFWINGKPGSGKSTFMKFLLNHDHTRELLHRWKSEPGQITASFFFRHQGTHLQKSFEGLLGSLFNQLLGGDPRLHEVVGDLQSESAADLYQTIQSDVDSFFRLYNVELGSTTHQKRMVALLSENPSLRLHRILEEEVSYLTCLDRLLIKQTLLRDFGRLSYVNRNESADVEKDFYGEDDARGKRDPHEKEKQSMCQKLLLQFPRYEKPIMAIVGKWCKSLDISSRIRMLLKEFQVTGSKQNDVRHLTGLIERQKIRLKRLIDYHLMWWTQINPEEGLRRIFNQNTFDLEVCLFFDALDEYDGSPEFISAFLKEVVQVKPTSKTRTKIVFSSRPWTIFRDQFDTCPKISIHEYTKDDIQEYCAGSLPKSSRANSLIRPLVDDITNRARGVFVWVKLVMADLIALVATNDEADDKLSKKLRECLKSLPDELEDYYSTIIHRLPVSTRRQSYILLECLSRASSTISVDEVPSLLACGMSDSFHEARDAIESGSIPGIEDPEGHLKTISGGLVDLVPKRASFVMDVPAWKRELLDTTKKSYVLQLMHQTVRDWVALPTFKHTILGTRADTTWQNGHSFLVKYYIHQFASFEKGVSGSEIFEHAVKAEMTTGVSQYTFLSQLPQAILTGIVFEIDPYIAELTTSLGHPKDLAKEMAPEQSYPQEDEEALIPVHPEESGFHGLTAPPGHPRNLAKKRAPEQRHPQKYKAAHIPGYSEEPVQYRLTAPPERPRELTKKRAPEQRHPQEYKAAHIAGYSEEPVLHGLTLAARSGLSLYLADSVQHDRLVFRRPVEPLLSIALIQMRCKSAEKLSDMDKGRLASIKLIINNGFNIQSDPKAISLIFEGIWESVDQQTTAMYTDLILEAVRNGLPVGERFDISLDPGNPTSLLHLSPPILAGYLLERGADPNRLNAAGQTPLDYILESESVFQREILNIDWLYDVVRLLLKNGAEQCKGTKHRQRLQCHKLFQKLIENGYDVRTLLALQNQSLDLDERSMSPASVNTGSEVADVTELPAAAGKRKVRNRLAKIFGGSGGSSRQ